MSKNEYIWNILMMGTKKNYNISMPCRNDMELFSMCTWMKVKKWMKVLDES
jgi:hypothetical protein